MIIRTAFILILLLTLGACSATVAGLDLHRTAPRSNICAPASDPRCGALGGDLALFVGGIYLQTTATRPYELRDVAGLSLMVGVVLADVVAGFLWPDRM
jgi:hypothetical protein